MKAVGNCDGKTLKSYKYVKIAINKIYQNQTWDDHKKIVVTPEQRKITLKH